MSMRLSQLDSEIPLSEISKDLAIEVQQHLFRLGYLPKTTDIDGIVGEKTLSSYAKFKKDNNLSHPLLLGKISAKLLKTVQPKIFVNRYQFDKIFVKADLSRRNQFFLPINLALTEFDINNQNRIAMFLAQVCHESGGLKWLEELASGSAYEGRADLGNIRRGDGQRYKGRGLIMITGRGNYKNVGEALDIKLEQFPTLALNPDSSARIAGHFWRSRGLNELADKNDFETITRRINGGLTGYKERCAELERIKSILA